MLTAPIDPSRGIYRAVWRWHFYAGFFCIPFILWLSVTGSIFLFKPQIERWLDRPYNTIHLSGPGTTPQQQAQAALAALPGSTLHAYELPQTPTDSTRVLVGRGTDEFRVYVHPTSLAILHIANEDQRPMKIVSRLHGELLAGDWGSRLVELAASWAIVMILTGLYLWWPRQTSSLAGVLYLRITKGRRIFWRDLHAVTGIWISAFALFLLLTGLPWARSWGTYLKSIRSLGHPTTLHQDWTIGGRSAGRSDLLELSHDMAGMNMAATDTTPHAMLDLTALNRIVRIVAAQHLAYPVLIAPARSSILWTAKSDAQNRTLRTTLTINGSTATITRREDFHQRPWIDRVVGNGISAHEGQLFGLANQLLGLITAIGLVLLCMSAIVMWWRRRATGILGAPLPLTKPRFSFVLTAAIVTLALYLPLLGLSLVVVLLTERYILRRIPSARQWLGLQTLT